MPHQAVVPDATKPTIVLGAGMNGATYKQDDVAVAQTLAETEAILRRAAGLGLGLHVHAEQVAWTGAAAR